MAHKAEDVLLYFWWAGLVYELYEGALQNKRWEFAKMKYPLQFCLQEISMNGATCFYAYF